MHVLYIFPCLYCTSFLACIVHLSWGYWWDRHGELGKSHIRIFKNIMFCYCSYFHLIIKCMYRLPSMMCLTNWLSYCKGNFCLLYFLFQVLSHSVDFKYVLSLIRTPLEYTFRAIFLTYSFSCILYIYSNTFGVFKSDAPRRS